MSRSGQSLSEILIGIALAVIFIIGAATLIAPSLQIGEQTAQVQTKNELTNQLLDNVSAWATGNWNSVLALATGTAHTYYLNTSSSPFTVATTSLSIEQVTISGVTYNRYFFLSDVYRDANGNATTTTTGTSYDPSTKLVTIVVSTSSTNPGLVSTLSFYLTRNRDNEFNQTSWAAGPGQNNPVTVASSSFATSSDVTITASGSIQLATSGGSCML